MPKKYIDIYREAEHRYLNKGKRSGYVRTLFSPLRHRGLNRGAVELACIFHERHASPGQKLYNNWLSKGF